MIKYIIFRLFKKITNFLSGKGLGKIPGVKTLYNYINKLMELRGIILISIRGNKMYVDTRDKGVVPFLLLNGIYEQYETELFSSFIKPGNIVCDIGANIGYYTLIAARLTGKYGRVYAFEPEPNNYKLLVKNIKKNKYKNIISIQKALADKNGYQRLFLDKFNLAAPSFSKDNIPLKKGGFIQIKTTTLDNFYDKYCKNFHKIDFIKMDTQGAEGLIIKGAKKVLKTFNIKIFMEFWPEGLNNLGTNPANLLKKLKHYGFKISLIDELNKKVRLIKISEIITICKKRKKDRNYVNLFLKK